MEVARPSAEKATWIQVPGASSSWKKLPTPSPPLGLNRYPLMRLGRGGFSRVLSWLYMRSAYSWSPASPEVSPFPSQYTYPEPSEREKFSASGRIQADMVNAPVFAGLRSGWLGISTYWPSPLKTRQVSPGLGPDGMKVRK